MAIASTCTYLGGAVRGYRFPVLVDERGTLTPLDFSQMPMSPVRAFLVEARVGAVRGGHAHRDGRQFLVRVSGEIAVSAEREGEKVALRLNELDNALLIEATVWSEQAYLTDDARLLVFCDTPYDPGSYIR